MRSVDEQGWRAAWGTHVNERLAELGIDARIDHRSFEDQGTELEPQHKIGRAARGRAEEGLKADRLEQHREIARENGERIIKNPAIAVDAITRQQATFTHPGLAMFAHRHSDGLDLFNTVVNTVQSSPEPVRLGRDGTGENLTSHEARRN